LARQGGHICFLDESATRGMSVCSWLCIAIVCFERGNAGVERVGYEVYRRVTSLAGWRRGELKWRKVKRAVSARANALEEIIRVIASGASYHNYGWDHLDASVDVYTLRRRLVEALLSAALRRLGWIRLAVFDQGLVPERNGLLARMRRAASDRSGGRIDRIAFRSSEKTIGVQLADLIAGYACDRLPSRPRSGCRRA